MKCFQNYRVKYTKCVREICPFSAKLEYWENHVEFEEVVQFIKSTPCYYEFYNKQTGKRFKILKENVISYEEV